MWYRHHVNRFVRRITLLCNQKSRGDGIHGQGFETKGVGTVGGTVEAYQSLRGGDIVVYFDTYFNNEHTRVSKREYGDEEGYEGKERRVVIKKENPSMIER
eukprot:PhF_6_TR19836/c0_g1_i1/m.28922